MSISIVSANASSTPTSGPGTESQGEIASGGLTFASLLLNQKTAALLSGENASSLQSDDKLLPSAEGTGDAAAMLASLGILGQDVRSSGAISEQTKTAPDKNKIGSVSLGSLGSPAQLASNSTSTRATEEKTALSGSLVETNETHFSEKKPANLAASLLDEPKEEPSASASSGSESTAASTPAVPTSSNSLSNRHESSLAISTHIRDQNWAQDFTQKISWLANNDKQSAQITLNPDQMGPIEISLNIDKGSATATFVSANAEVRDAIETAMPRLREMFASAGIDLGQTNVSAESFRQQAGSGEGSANRGEPRKDVENVILGTESALSPRMRTFASQRGNGMVDIFA